MVKAAAGFEDLKVRKKKNDILIGVLAGGISSERKVSLKTGNNILGSLQRSGYKAVLVDPRDSDFIDSLKKIDIAFLALHGRYGEDGTVQGPLKKLMYIDGKIERDIGYPVVVKPNNEGSTIGISKAESIEELETGVKLASRYDKRIMIEKYIRGRELTVGVIGREPRALPVIEIKPKSGFFDYDSKYIKNLTEYIVPAEIEVDISEKILGLSLRCHQGFSCLGISRVDFILDKENIPYVLELNTMPGMTSTSLVPMAAKAAGIDFDHLVEIILDSADLKIC